MATSGSTNFTLDLKEIAEEAFERAGLRLHSGYDLETAMRSLNLMFIEWQNRGTNFWTIDHESTSLVAGTATYNMDTDAFDGIEFYVRDGSGDSQLDLPVTRISLSQYHAIPNKNETGRPTSVWINKTRARPVMYLWPVPDQAYTLVWQQLSKIEDTGSPADLEPDVPYRFLPALVAGLAYHIAMKRKEAADRVQILKMDYEEQWNLAVAGDRDRATWRIRPNLRGYAP